ncbi:MAG TPA: YadA-like family protein [Thiopseudomonas sp.]|nr:YadA-like family protein [Thiopseudomonas sp.]
MRKTLGNMVLTVGLSSMAVAVQAATGVGGGVAIGQSNHTCSTSAQAGHNQAVAIGCGSEAGGTGTQFFDRENPDNPNPPPQNRSHYSTAIGTGAKADSGGVAIGHNASNETGFGIAIGANATSENVASIALGPTALATGNTALALGRQSAATGDFAQALGNVSSATGKGSLAVGHSATASGNRSIAIGSADIDNAGNTGDQQGTVYQTQEQTLSTGKDSIAFGAAAKATADHTLAIGAHAKAEGINALALGAHSKADKDRSIAVGVGAQANFVDSVALGSNSEVLHDNSVAIGTGSKTNAYDQEAFLVGGAATGAVAVGSVNDERRLQNVAAGALDTDGVNVSQLKQHKTITDQTGGDVANHLGGGATFNSETGEITNPTYNIGGVAYTNVESALKASKTEVEEGTNIKVSEAKGADGQTIYTVSTAAEVEFEKVTVGDVVIDHTANTIVGLANTEIGNAAPADFATVGRAATEEQLNLSAGSTSTILGGNVTNNNGELTGPFVVNQHDYTTVAEAIEGEAAKSKTSVTQGNNIVVTKTQNADGSDNYKVATATEVGFNKVTVGNVVIDHTDSTITGLSNTTLGGVGFGSAGRSATEEQLNLSAGSTSTILGGNVTNNNGRLTGPFVVNQHDYTTVAEAIEREAAKSKTSVSEGSNIVVTKSQNADGSDNYEVATADEVEFKSITAIDVNATNVNTESLSISNGGPVINSDGINMYDKRITNVAAGIDGTDAVNVNQLQTVHNDLRNEIGGVRRDLHKVDRKLRAGVAAAMATAGLPQAYLPGKSMVGVAGGTWNGESGVALGVSKITDNGKWIFKVSGNASTRGDYGGTVGAGYQW